MSNLQIGLAVAGGLVLVAVVAHGAWTSRKNAPKQPLPENRQEEPSLDAHEPSLDGEGVDDIRPLTLPAAPKRPAMDSLIDVIASVSLDSAVGVVSGEAAIAAMPSTRRAGTKPFAIEGLNAESNVWEVPHPGQRYSSFQAGVQLSTQSLWSKPRRLLTPSVPRPSFPKCWTKWPAPAS
jgi:hypothetical protein